MPLIGAPTALEPQVVGDGERRADHGKVDERLDEAARIGDEGAQPAAIAREAGAPLDVGEHARELHEQREREQHADEGHPDVVEHVVGQARSAEPGRDDCEQNDGALLGETVVDEPVRRVVAPALIHGPAVEQPHDRDERRVQDGNREHEDRQQQCCDGRPGDLPARGQTERREREPEHLAARVAHEDRR